MNDNKYQGHYWSENHAQFFTRRECRYIRSLGSSRLGPVQSEQFQPRLFVDEVEFLQYEYVWQPFQQFNFDENG